MIKIKEVSIYGFEEAIRGLRNPMNSWNKSDSRWVDTESDTDYGYCYEPDYKYVIGKNDLELMSKLSKAGTDHRKFMRMIVVYADITAPLYWFKEYDTYKVGTVANSCSTMHTIHKKPIELSDFSIDNVPIEDGIIEIDLKDMFINVIEDCECLRKKYIETNDKKYWKALIQLLPSSYNQKRTVMLNYEVLANMYHARKAHKLDEWREFCKWVEELPYSELITQ